MSLLTHRGTGRRDESGSMAFYLVLAVVGLAIASLLVPLIITSARTTRSDTSRTHALDAAQAGLSVMLGEIRAARSDGVGTSVKLPCANRTGAVDSTSAASYTVSVAYYVLDPVTNPGAQKMTCVDGYGTFDPVSSIFTPKYARITSTGTDGPVTSGSTSGRRLQTTYVFKTSNTNIVGGQIPMAQKTTLCLDAGSASPTSGALVRVQTCSTPPTDQQIFAYRSDLTLQLVSSVGATYPTGLCIDTQAPTTTGRSTFLAVCSVLGSPAYTQQWSFGDPGGSYAASRSDSATTGTLSGACLAVPSLNPGVQVSLASCTGDIYQQWLPNAAVGPGAAQLPQWVNFAEFGRCLDVTNQDVNSNHLISYPCKQNPFPSAVTWNQKFTTPTYAAGATSATGQLTTTVNGSTYCLTSPGTEGGYATVSVCAAGNTRQSWKVYNGDATLGYATKYTIVDSASRCLGLGRPVGSEFWSSITVDTCTGATAQKWNATPDLTTSATRDTTETRLTSAP